VRDTERELEMSMKVFTDMFRDVNTYDITDK